VSSSGYVILSHYYSDNYSDNIVKAKYVKVDNHCRSYNSSNIHYRVDHLFHTVSQIIPNRFYELY